MRAVVLPGRFDRVGDDVFAGAHNPAGIEWLVERLPRADYVVVASTLADKDADAMLRSLARAGDTLVATASHSARALPADELTPFVEKLARRIASFPAHAIAHAKAAVDRGAFSSMAEGLLVEAHESDSSVASEVTKARMTEVLKLGGETYEGELEMDYLSRLCPTG